MKTNDDLVRELADREAIRELSDRHCDCLYREDLDGLVNLFTQDGAFIANDLENEVVTRGHAELKKMYRKIVKEVRPEPIIHAQVIELRSTTSATGRCYVELRSAKVDMERVGSGCYQDEYVKIGEHWKIATRRLIGVGMSTPLRTFMAS